MNEELEGYVRVRALSPTDSFIVEAPAGSGKTELLTQRFLKLLSTVQNPEEILAITFTRKASNEMRLRIINKGYTGDPQRLRIMTIDAFCNDLVARMPLKSKQTYEFNISESPEKLYQQAVHNIFLYQHSESLKKLLLHVDNDALRLTELCMDMLSHRDQWLPYMFGLEGLSELENNLKKSRDFLIQRAYRLLPAQYHIPEAADVFLTKKAEWRKKAPLSENPELVEVLVDLFHAPDESYSTAQKDLIQSLAELLPILVAELQLVFKENNQVDFIEINLRALNALGTEDEPTDLALYLDYALKHLLIDEFQDTSVMQLKLIERLVAGWEPHDGRTLFLVGDPMQSIYRFRKAEVGLFLHAQREGIKNIKLINLRLIKNFRTVDKLVDWHNEFFAKLFPQHSNETLGAVAYKPSLAHKTSHNQAVFYSAEQDFLNIIKNNLHKHTAVLVRSRTHLKPLLELLHKENIAYRGTDIAFLEDNIIVQDLFSLTKALLNLKDRIAWLSILRAPWCNASLKILYDIAGTDHQSDIWTLIQFQSGLENFKSSVGWALDNTRRLSLRAWVEKTWLKLNGPDFLKDQQELNYVNAYLDLLDKYDDIEIIGEKLSTLGLPQNSDPNIKLEIMTIHKSKGLEFDVVILPGLGRPTRPDSSKLLLWSERINYLGEPELLVAPLKHKSESENKTYQYLKREESKRAYYEMQRVLYVAATRAKECLYILQPESEKTAKNSLLSQLMGVENESVS
ncbi:MAG TPA: UvrD-helicase domain-containing protein [Gammaproteobacteria bacterium]|nr:UvrD-helicase domain-containing protein [Gammaproteobacteria bacterium]